MDLKHITNLSSIVLLTLVITTVTTAYSANTLTNDTKTSTQSIENANKTTITSSFTKVALKRSGKTMDTKKHSTPYIQILNLNEAGSANFASGHTTISKKGQTSLNLFVKQVITSGIPPSSITIIGHTDNIGTKKANQYLSEQRAIAVANHLASKGLDSTLMHVTGLGETRPVATNGSQVGRAQNNRVFIRVHSLHMKKGNRNIKP